MYLFQDNDKWNIGAAEYYIGSRSDIKNKFPVAIRCCIGNLLNEELALIDTGACYSMINEDTFTLIKASMTYIEDVHIITARGLRLCKLYMMPIQLLADYGEPLSIEILTAVVPDWPEQTIIGMRGGLEKIRCAFDPGTKDDALFYFGSAG